MTRLGILRTADWHLVVRYLVVRRQVHDRYEAAPLPALLTWERRGEDVALAPGLASVRLAESIIRRLSPWPDTCLFRAMTRFVVLREVGHAVTFHMGVDLDDPTTGHAWIELAGRPLLEEAPRHLTTTFTHP